MQESLHKTLMKRKRWYKILINLLTSDPLVLVIGWYRGFVFKQYSKMFTQDKLKDIVYMAATHPECALNGFCEDCGCPFLELTVSDKKCKRL